MSAATINQIATISCDENATPASIMCLVSHHAQKVVDLPSLESAKSGSGATLAPGGSNQYELSGNTNRESEIR